MKFSDLDEVRKHQLAVNFAAFNVACLALSKPEVLYDLLRKIGSSPTPEAWAMLLGEVAAQEVRTIPEEYKNKLIQRLDEAIEHGNQTGKSFLLIVEE